MSQNYTITDADVRHLEQLEVLEKQCFSVPWTKEQLFSQFPDDRHVFIVAVRNETVLGYVGMAYVLDEGYISNVAVSPEERRQGIGDALISELLRRAVSLDLSFVTLEVRESNAPASALYGKHGFIPVGLRKNYYDKPTENAVLMTNFLK